MKKVVPSLVLLSITALGGALFFTNPSEEDYAQYLSQTAADKVEASVCQPDGFSKWLGKVGEAISQACTGLVAGGESLSQAEVQDIIIENTEYKNRILFSTYVTETPFGDYKGIGFFNKIIIEEQTEVEAI